MASLLSKTFKTPFLLKLYISRLSRVCFFISSSSRAQGSKAVREDIEGNQNGLDMPNDGRPVKAVDSVGDTEISTRNRGVADEETKGPNSNTTSDEDDPNIQDLRRRAGGYDLDPQR
ncbi:uncharacterized protein LOC133033514 [Cannabis sativa]|uniref:uncharacterized protein LOC133033514 n=1 Tax=Cannabis sativa TaxID=3483 RepID=UPI0029CA6507|nr:uncharacterized protein LOC133033514 [Cannabis sativa]